MAPLVGVELADGDIVDPEADMDEEDVVLVALAGHVPLAAAPVIFPG